MKNRPVEPVVAESVVAEGVGTAVARNNDPGKRIENAMSNAVIEASKEAEEIWHRKDLDEEKKQEMINEIMSDDAIRSRKLVARVEIRRILSEEDKR